MKELIRRDQELHDIEQAQLVADGFYDDVIEQELPTRNPVHITAAQYVEMTGLKYVSQTCADDNNEYQVTWAKGTRLYITTQSL